MKVLHINCNYMTTVLHQTMMEHLDKTGVQSHVFAPICDVSKAVIVPRENVTVSKCFGKWDRIHFGFKQRKILTSLECSVDVASFDCIHAYTLFTDGNCAREMSRKYGIPYVVAVRSTDMNDFFRIKPWLIGRGIKIMEDAAAVFFLSPRYMEEMLTRYVPESKRDCIQKKSRVVPNGIDDFWLQNVPISPGADVLKRLQEKKVNLVVAGRINKNKNQMTVMRAVERMNAQGWDVHLTVVGNVEDRGVADALKRNPAVTVLPPQKKEQLLQTYRANDIFVLSSHQETFGLVYAEAMSQGLPVLYTKNQGFDGQFPEGTVGYSITPNSSEEIAQKVAKVCEEYHCISSVVPQLSKTFSWNDIVREYATIYGSIAGN